MMIMRRFIIICAALWLFPISLWAGINDYYVARRYFDQGISVISNRRSEAIAGLRPIHTISIIASDSTTVPKEIHKCLAICDRHLYHHRTDIKWWLLRTRALLAAHRPQETLTSAMIGLSLSTTSGDSLLLIHHMAEAYILSHRYHEASELLSIHHDHLSQLLKALLELKQDQYSNAQGLLLDIPLLSHDLQELRFRAHIAHIMNDRTRLVPLLELIARTTSLEEERMIASATCSFFKKPQDLTSLRRLRSVYRDTPNVAYIDHLILSSDTTYVSLLTLNKRVHTFNDRDMKQRALLLLRKRFMDRMDLLEALECEEILLKDSLIPSTMEEYHLAHRLVVLREVRPLLRVISRYKQLSWLRECSEEEQRAYHALMKKNDQSIQDVDKAYSNTDHQQRKLSFREKWGNVANEDFWAMEHRLIDGHQLSINHDDEMVSITSDQKLDHIAYERAMTNLMDFLKKKGEIDWCRRLKSSSD